LLKKRRAGVGALPQRALAEQLGVKPSHIAYLESGGKRKPSLALMGLAGRSARSQPATDFLLEHPEAEAVVNPSMLPAAAQVSRRRMASFRERPAFSKEAWSHAPGASPFKELRPARVCVFRATNFSRSL